MMKLIIFFLHIFQLFLDDTKVKNFITCFKGTCTSQFVSVKLVHVADVTYPWLTMCAKQYRDPCFGSQMDSVNYQQCFSNFPFNLITVADPGEGSPCLIFGPNWGPNGRKKFFWETAPPLILGSRWPGPPLISMSGFGTGLANWTMAFFIKWTVVRTQILVHG